MSALCIYPHCTGSLTEVPYITRVQWNACLHAALDNSRLLYILIPKSKTEYVVSYIVPIAGWSANCTANQLCSEVCHSADTYCREKYNHLYLSPQLMYWIRQCFQNIVLIYYQLSNCQCAVYVTLLDKLHSTTQLNFMNAHSQNYVISLQLCNYYLKGTHLPIASYMPHLSTYTV